MHDPAPYCYSAHGNVIVLADGPELLVYSANNDQGIWKLMAEDILMGVGVTEDQVLTVDAAGRITAYRAIDGQQKYQLDTDTAPIAVRVSPSGHVAILEADGLCIVRPGSDPLRLSWSQPRVAAWGPDEASLGVGGADGQFHVVDPTSGGAWGTQALGAAITGVAWRANGTWAVAHGQQVSFVSGDGTELVGSLPVGGPTGEVTVSVDGAILAVISTPQKVNLYELGSNGHLGDVTFQRDVLHLQFGPKHWLGFGFDDGDANRLDVASGSITRTQAHQGRGQNAWAMNASVNQALVRGGIASVASAGQSIAAVGKVKADKSPIKKKRSLKWLWLGLGAGAVLLFVFCCGGGSLMAGLPMIWHM